MAAFVTGGSGFVGRYLIETLRADGEEVRALARSDAAVQTVASLGAKPVRGSLDDREVMTTAMEGCSAVYHAAAHVQDWGSPALFHRVNVTGTENALAAAHEARVDVFVHVGTEAVLVGGPPIVNVDEARPLPDNPLGLYPLTKGLAERRVVAANGTSLRTVVIRPRLIWGKDDTSVLAKLVDAVKARRFMWIGGGRYFTSTCHVRNVCAGALLAAQKGRGGSAYFLTDGPPVEFRSFVTSLLATQGVAPGNRSVPRFVAYAAGGFCEWSWRRFGFSGNPPITRSIVCLIGSEVTVNDSKARHELGYREVITREAGLEEMTVS